MFRRLVVSALLVGASFAVHAEAEIGLDNANAIHGHRRIAIAEFDVEFMTQIYAHDHASGGSFGGASSMLTASLAGVGPATMQAITDQTYADTVAALRAAGFDVVDPAELAANADWQALVAKYGLDSPYTFSDSSLGDKNPQISQIVAPSGGKAFFSSSTARGDFGQRTAAQNAGRASKEVAIAKALNADLLYVHYLASFGVTSKPKRGWRALSATFADSSINVSPVLLPDDTEIQIISQSGQRYFTTSKRTRFNGAVFLDDPYIVEPNIFTLSENTSSADRKNDAIGNAIGGLFGTGMQKTKSFIATPSSEDDFRTSYIRMIDDAGKGFADALGKAL